VAVVITPAAGVAAQRGKAQLAVGPGHRLVRAAPADHHRLAAQLRIAQQLDAGIERVHVQMRDEAGQGEHGSRSV